MSADAPANWDKVLCEKLRSWGVSREQAMFIVGEVAEQRQLADREGYRRGYENGYHNALVKVNRPKPGGV